MIVLVTGGREYFNRNHVFQVLDAVHQVEEITLLIEGGANGADTFAYEWAAKNEVDSYRCRAKWKKYQIEGRKNPAGMIRNKAMLSVMGRYPDMFVVFPGGRGTSGMVSLVEEVNADEEIIEILDEREMDF